MKEAVEKNEQGKKAKNLWEAWKVASEGHDLEYFKQLLMDHEKAMMEDAEERAAKEAEKAEKVAKKAKRKSKGGEDEDVEMEDAAGSSDSTSKKSSAKKRKKDADAEADGEKVSVRCLLFHECLTECFKARKDAQDQAQGQWPEDAR